jgi:hypothetical protein
MTARAKPLTGGRRRAVTRLARGVTTVGTTGGYNTRMKNLAQLPAVIATGSRTDVDRFLSDLHTELHDRPLDHLRVHLAWMRVQWSRRAYARAAFHAFAGLVVAMPASLVQRYTGVVNPAFRR